MTKKTLDEIFSPIKEISSHKYYFMINSAYNTLKETLPENSLEAGFEHFIRLYMRKEKPILELSLFTYDYCIHDLTYTIDEQVTYYMQFTKETFIELKTFFPAPPEETDKFNVNSESPYRAELNIIREGGGLYYSAEGERRIVNSLIQYGNKLLYIMHSLK